MLDESFDISWVFMRPRPRGVLQREEALRDEQLRGAVEILVGQFKVAATPYI